MNIIGGAVKASSESLSVLVGHWHWCNAVEFHELLEGLLDITNDDELRMYWQEVHSDRIGRKLVLAFSKLHFELGEVNQGPVFSSKDSRHVGWSHSSSVNES